MQPPELEPNLYASPLRRARVQASGRECCASGDGGLNEVTSLSFLWVYAAVDVKGRNAREKQLSGSGNGTQLWLVFF